MWKGLLISQGLREEVRRVYSPRAPEDGDLTGLYVVADLEESSIDVSVIV